MTAAEWDAVQRQYWSTVADVYNDLYRSAWSRLEDEWVTSQLAFLRDLRRPLVVDLGCGTGLGADFVLRWNANATYLGIDISPAMAAQAAEEHGVECVVGSMDDLSWLRDSSVDVVLALFSSASYARSPLHLMTEIHRVLKPGGIAYVSTLTRRRGCTAVDTYVTRGHHASTIGVPAHRFRQRELAALARAAGFVHLGIRGINAFSGICEAPPLWRFGRTAARLNPNWSHLLELTCTKPSVGRRSVDVPGARGRGHR